MRSYNSFSDIENARKHREQTVRASFEYHWHDFVVSNPCCIDFASSFRACCFDSIDVTGRALGHDHEQSLEAIHVDFDKVWSRYRVNDVSSPSYGDQLLGAVLNINAAHTPLWRQMDIEQASYVLLTLTVVVRAQLYSVCKTTRNISISRIGHWVLVWMTVFSCVIGIEISISQMRISPTMLTHRTKWCRNDYGSWNCSVVSHSSSIE